MPAFKNRAAEEPLPEAGSDPSLSDLERITPREVLANAFRFWWVIAVFTLAGGIIGMTFSRLHPPVYEAVGRFSAGIDYVLTGPLTQFEEDTALNKIGDLIWSRPVLDAVVEQARAEGFSLTRTDLRRMATVERRNNNWDLRIRHTDPQTAERIANIWVEQGQEALLESYRHALQAESLNRYIQTLESCLAAAAASEPAHAVCSRYRFAEIQANLAEAGQAFYQERVASRGLFAGLVIGPPAEAVVSEKPVLYRQGQLVLAGGMLGMLLAAGLVQSGLLARWLKRN